MISVCKVAYYYGKMFISDMVFIHCYYYYFPQMLVNVFSKPVTTDSPG